MGGMKLQFLQFIRNSLLSQEQLEERQNAILAIKTAKAVSKGISMLGAAFSLLDLYHGKILRPLALIPLAYLASEAETIAENCREILEDPRAELRAICAGSHSNEKLWKYIAKQAPLSEKIGLLYLDSLPKEPPPAPQCAVFGAKW